MKHHNTKLGLSTSEVEEARVEYGRNTLQLKKKRSLILAFLDEFKDLMIIILIIATVISFAVGETKDGSVIAFIIVLNAIIGFMQKYRAEKAVEALNSMLAPQARVLRNGEQALIPAEELVPGDIVLLYEGDRIPADGEIFQENECETQEAILTGESTPVSKSEEEGQNRIYMGTTISHGSARAVITQTGMQTEFGRIATLTTSTEKDLSPLQKELNSVGVFVGKMTFVITVILVGVGIFLQHQAITEAILFGASVAVAAVPEGLPTTITIALAIGVQRLAKKHAIMKQLSSVETLGSTTVIVSDKTGTLTKNEMTVEKIFANSGTSLTEKENEKLIGLVCNLCNNAKIIQGKTLGDPTEGALITFAEKLGFSQEEAIRNSEILYELPFDSKRKRMTVIARIGEKVYALCKGAPDSILEVSSVNNEEKKLILKINEEGASQALRMIAFAYRELSNEELSGKSEDHKKKFTIASIEKNLIYLGMVGMMDPPREEVPQAIKLAQKAGIRVIILTGDHGLTAKAIAEKIGLIEKNKPFTIITGSELDNTSDEDLIKILSKPIPTIFARVSPENKLRVVEILKQQGEIVAVTGDGVNDAPALKRADIGVAMGIAGTDVSKEAANMILADDSFSTIVSAIQEGRTVYENLKKFLMYMFSSNMGELVIIFMAIILGLKQPLTAIMILLINIGTDVLPALALGLEPSKQEYMELPPRNQNEKILKTSFIKRLFFMGFIIGGISLIAYSIGLSQYTYSTALTMTYATLVIAQMFNTYNSRDPLESAFKSPFSNLYLIGAIIISVGFTIATIQLPFLQRYLETTDLNATQWLIVVGLSSFTLIIEEIRKYIMRRHTVTTLTAITATHES